MTYRIDKSFRPSSLKNPLIDEIENEESPIGPHFSDMLPEEERYEYVSLLGTGALKEVHKCYDHKLKRHIALARTKKELNQAEKEVWQDADQKLIHEAWITSRLCHPNIIKIHGISQEEGRPFFTMDLKENYSLTKFRQQTTSMVVLLQSFLNVCSALHYAHEQGVIHLDLKPENIQCGPYGEILVCDWGLAKCDLAYPHNLTAVAHLVGVRRDTLYGEVKGSLGYLAPEQIEKGGEKDHRSDIYALGCLLYFLLTGTQPYTGSKNEVLAATLNDATPLATVSHPRAGISTSLARIAQKAMAHQPEHRYQSVADLQSDLELYLSDRPTSLDKSRLLPRVSLFLKRHQREAFLVALFLIASLLAGCFIWNHIHHQERNLLQAKLKEEQLAYEVKIRTLETSLLRRKDEAFLLPLNPLNGLSRLWNRDLPQRISGLQKRHENKPEDENVARTLAVSHLMTMNFKKALELIGYLGEPYQLEVLNLIGGFEHYSFTDEYRPSLQEILAFLDSEKNGAKVDWNHSTSILIACMLNYDYTTRPVGTDYTDIILEYWRLINTNVPNFTIEHNEENSHLEISATNAFWEIPVISARSLLQYTQFNTVSIKSNMIYCDNISHVQTRCLDLSQCRKIVFRDTPAYIPGLEVLVTNQPSSEEDIIRQHFLSDREYIIQGF